MADFREIDVRPPIFTTDRGRPGYRGTCDACVGERCRDQLLARYRAVMLVGGGLLVATGILEVTGVWNAAVQHLQTLLPGSTIL